MQNVVRRTKNSRTLYICPMCSKHEAVDGQIFVITNDIQLESLKPDPTCEKR